MPCQLENSKTNTKTIDFHHSALDIRLFSYAFSLTAGKNRRISNAMSAHRGSSHSHAHDHGRNHSHDHAAHADTSTADGRRRVAIACLLTTLFMIAEVIGGIISGSLALIADAAHMMTDAASLALAWLGYWFAAKPADETRSYGFGRMRVLAAFTNGLALLALSVWIMVEGVQRLADPQPVIGGIMLWVAMGGLVVNILAFAILHGGDSEDINLSGAVWHVAGDLLGSVAAILAATIIIFTNWTPIDPILSMLVAILIFIAGVRITRRAGHILLQGAPEGLTPDIIRAAIIDHVEGVKDARHIHAWTLTEDQPMVTMDVTAAPGTCTESLRRAIKQRLETELNVHHVTVEIVSDIIVKSEPD